MSVINQMLKDLDKRQEAAAPNGQSVVPSAAVRKSPLIPVIITVIVTLTLVAVIFLYAENKTLKQQSHAINQQQKVEEEHNQNKRLIGLKKDTTSQNETIEDNTTPAQYLLGDTEKNSPSSNAKVTNVEPIKAFVNTPEAKYSNKSPEQSQSSQPIAQTLQVTPQQEIIAKTKAGEAGEGTNLEKQPDSKASEIKVPVSQAVAQPATLAAQKPASLSISRKKLSAKELTVKKMAQAEQAMLNKNIELAEQYFEEILIISPSHVPARKQLAALLYGRHSTQAAINILSQGIHIAPDNSELRLMLARVFSEKGFNQQALNTLTPLADTLDVAYQAAIATSAQSLSAHQEAINAFSHLVNLQQGQSRWYLGLAVSYDRLGQYPQAVDAYQQAIIIGNLSESSLTFAKQRTLELGES